MTDFPPQLPHDELTEVFPDVFFVQGQIKVDFGKNIVSFSRTMTVVRDGDGLTLFNTLRLDAAGLEYLESLGKVTNIVRLGAFHGRDDAFYLARYKADMWALAGTDHQRGVTTDKVLVAGENGPCSDGTVFSFETATAPECIYHLARHGGIIVSCDSFQNMLEPDRFFDAPTIKLMTEGGFFNKANIGPGWLKRTAPQRSDFERLMELKFCHLISAHGAPLIDEAHFAMNDSINRKFES